MSILLLKPINDIKNYLFGYGKTVLKSTDSIAPGAIFVTGDISVKTNTIGLVGRFTAAHATIKFEYRLTAIDDLGTGVWFGDWHPINKGYGSEPSSNLQFLIETTVPVKKFRVEIRHDSSTATSGAKIFVSENRKGAINNDTILFDGRTLALGDNNSIPFRVSKKHLSINIQWATEPTNYEVILRAKDKQNRVVTFKTVFTGNSTNKSPRRVIKGYADSDVVDINIRVLAGAVETGSFTSCFVSTSESAEPPAKDTVVDLSADSLLFSNKTLTTGDNITPKVNISDKSVRLTLYWQTASGEPDNYEVFLRSYDTLDNLVYFESIFVSKGTKLERRIIDAKASTGRVDVNIKLATGSTGTLRSLTLSQTNFEIDSAVPPHKTVAAAVIVPVGDTFVTPIQELADLNVSVNLMWGSEPLHYEVLARYYDTNGTTILNFETVFSRKAGVRLDRREFFIRAKTHLVDFRIYNYDVEKTLTRLTIATSPSPDVGAYVDKSRTFDPVNLSNEVLMSKQSAGFDRYFNSNKVQNLIKADFFHSIIPWTLKTNNTTITDYVFLQKDAKSMRLYLAIDNITGAPFTGETDGVTLSVSMADGTYELISVTADKIKSGFASIVLGQQPFGADPKPNVKHASPLLGDKVIVRLTFSGTINTTNNFRVRVIGYSKFI